MFDEHMPAKFKSQAPRVERREDGSDVWIFNGAVIPNIGLNAVAGRPKEEYGVEPTAFDEMRPGCYDIDERIKDMNAGGVLASMNFPSFPGFSARLFAAAEDKDLALADGPRRTTTGTSTSGAGTYPGRFIPMALPVLWDPELAAARGPPGGGQGLSLADVHRKPRDAGLPELPRRALGSAVEGAGRRECRAVHPPRLVRQAGDHRRRMRPST